MSEPNTLLSLVYHATITGVDQDKLHTDIDGTFKEYEVTDATREGFKVPGTGVDISKLARAGELLTVAKAIEEVAGVLRTVKRGSPEDAAAKAKLAPSTTKFFTLMAPWLAAELTLGVPQPDQPEIVRPSPTGPLLKHLYQTVYSSSYRAKNLGDGGFPQGAWVIVAQAIKDGKGNFNQLLAACDTLCAELANEFINDFWESVW